MAASESTSPARRAGEQGFTLIELLVSVFLLSLILALVGAGFSTVSKGWSRHADRISRQDMLLRAQSQFRADIANLQRLAWPERKAAAPRDAQQDPEDRRGPEFVFRGEPDRLSFIVVEPPYPARPGPYVLDYEAMGGKTARLDRSRARFHPETTALANLEFSDRVSLVSGAYRFRFSYGEPQSGVSSEGAGLRWLPSWSAEDRLPALIRLEIRNAGSGKLALPAIVARPRLDAEPGCAERKASTSGCLIAQGSRTVAGDTDAEERSDDSADRRNR